MKLTKHWPVLVTLAVVLLQAGILFWFGQPAIYAGGFVKLWEGVVSGDGNSQHLTDWYTFSHIIHGFIFYWILTLVAPKLSTPFRLLLAVGVEVGWEVLENTPMVINHYRQQALAAGYMGDSIINSVSDTIAMVLGFLWAWRMPVWSTVLAAVGLELFVGYSIKDNLTLNVINLIYQFDFIKNWQSR
jgi:hypothetical protein